MLTSLQQKELDDLLAQISKQETECLQKIFARYCLVTCSKMDLSRISRQTFDSRPNYWEYWVDEGLKSEKIIMSREVIIKDGAPVLNILFPSELVREGE